MFLTKDFQYEELCCPCCQRLESQEIFLKAVQGIRTRVNRPFHVNSYYRCHEHNFTLIEKGLSNLSSRHLQGFAIDISTRGWAPDDLHYLMFELFSFQDETETYNTGVGIYRHHIHFDFRQDQESCWVKL